MGAFNVLIVAVVFTRVLSLINNDGIINTRNGYVKGKTQQLPRGKEVQSYLGIPYALPPVGELRFKHPIPADPWSDVLNATQFGFTCYQKNLNYFKDIPGFDRILPTTTFSEDCLTLNVFVPLPFPRNASVMVFIHGGGYSIGGTSAKFYDGAYFAAEENIIVVTFNYRLASLGFLFVEHPEMDANCGLMDQNLALTWVNKNIRFFGGNPEEVTLFGQSVGSVSIGLHMISPLSKGLFKRGILQSGTPLMEWLIHEKWENEGFAVQTGNQLNCNYTTGRDGLVNCLKNVSPRELINNEPKMKLLPFIFMPVVDGKFLVDHPVEMIKTGKNYRNIDILIGTLKDEGTFFLSLSQPLVFFPLINEIAPHHEDFMNVVRFYIQNQCDAFYKSVELLYTDWDNFNDTSSNLKSANSFITDYFFECKKEDFTQYYSSRGSNVYSYYFTYRSPQVDYAKWIGVPHTEELRYVMGEVTTLNNYSSEDKTFGLRMMRYWANFARTGNPNISPRGLESYESIYWPKYNENCEVLTLAPQTKEVIRHTPTKRCQFWNTIYPEYKTLKENSICPVNN